jgi:hypothetical protein
VDSTGLKLCGAGEWLVEKHGTKTRRSWRKLHIALDADTGQIVAAALTAKEIRDGAAVGPLLNQVPGPLASFTADGAYDQEGVCAVVTGHSAKAAIIVPPRATAVPSETADIEPTQRDRHLHSIAKHGRAAWQNASGYTKRARVEAAIGRFKRVIGDGLRSRTDGRTPSGRSSRRRPYPKPHAGAGPPDLHPYPLTPQAQAGQSRHTPGPCNVATPAARSRSVAWCRRRWSRRSRS